jgi:hypothetical protein
MITVSYNIGHIVYKHIVFLLTILQMISFFRIILKSINLLLMLLMQLKIMLLPRIKFARGSIAGYLKEKLTISIIQLAKHKISLEPKNNFRDKIIVAEKYSCWCFLVIDKAILEAKIIHKGRGRFKVLDDKYSGKYIGQIVDASDVVRCSIDI